VLVKVGTEFKNTNCYKENVNISLFFEYFVVWKNVNMNKYIWYGLGHVVTNWAATPDKQHCVVSGPHSGDDEY
jgi:hypothetical protein